MSLKILKAGILDTIQDEGRFGYQHLGINPGGAMDLLAMQTANLLTGNEMNKPVIEFFYPAAEIYFEKNALIAITGANFSPTLNGQRIKNGVPVMVKKKSVLAFSKKKNGQCCYLTVQGGFNLLPWLNSNSTNLKAMAGGYEGRKLMKGDILEFNTDFKNERLKKNDFYKLSWRSVCFNNESAEDEIFVIPGNEWNYLMAESKNNFTNNEFHIAISSDRMGYRLNGENLVSSNKEELVSSAVNFGTIQLLPNGELIILMADSQTTGGYPRVAHIVSAHLSKLSQKQPGSTIKFTIVNQQTAENLFMKQQLHLQQLKNGCNFKLQQFLT